MNPTTLRIQIPAASSQAPRSVGTYFSQGPVNPAARRVGTPSGTLELARACSAVAAQVERTETLSLLAIAVGGAVVLAGAAADIAQALARWPAFEHFVRSVLA